MKLQTHRYGEYGLLCMLCVFAGAWLLHVAGMFSFSDKAFEDLCYRFDHSNDRNNPILLVYAPPEMLESNDPRLVELLSRLDDSSPQKIGIIAETPLLQQPEIEQLSSAKNIVIGRTAQKMRENIDSPLQQGFIDLSLDGQPVYRQHKSVQVIDGEIQNSFERMIAAERTFGDGKLPDGNFGIKFSGGINTLPHVDVEEIFAGKIISEMIKNKVVLIGKRMNRDYGFATPTATGSQRMTRLELHGHILNTLLRENFREPTHKALDAILLAIFTILVCQLARQTFNTWLPQAMAACIAAVLLLGWLGHSLISIQFPVSAMAFIIVAGFGMSALSRFRILHLAAEYWRLMMDLNQKELDATPEKAWDLITDAVFQMFYPKRMVLMAMKPNATHLSVVSTINCQPEDIYEKRRDAQRIPYRDAIQLERPLNVKQRCFFHETPVEDEIEYMVPLLFSSQVIGFMVIAMEASALEKWKDFENFLGQFANDMSIVIANQKANEQSSRRQSVPVRKLKSFPEEKTLQRIQTEKLEQQNRVQRLNSAFEGSESAMAICDVFGRILRANSRLIRLLQDIEIVTGETSCVEMITQLTKRPVSDCRRIFQLAIMNNRANQMCIPPTQERPYPCIMFVKPLTCKSQEATGDINYRRVVIEVVDGQSFEMINNWQNQLTDNIYNNANEQLAMLQSQLQYIKKQDPNEATFEILLNSFNDSVSNIRSTLSRCQEIVHSQLTEKSENCFPLETLEIYRAAFQHYEQVLESRGIEIVHDFDEGGCLGIANPFLLEKTFLAIMDLLYENAFDHSQLFISAQMVGDKTHFQFRNRGGGTPLQGLRKSLVSDDESTPDKAGEKDQPSYLPQNQMDRLAEIQDWLNAWEGSLRIANLADYSLNIELTLMNESMDYPDKTGKVQEKSQSPRS